MVSLIKLCSHRRTIETSALGEPYRTWYCPECLVIICVADVESGCMLMQW